MGSIGDIMKENFDCTQFITFNYFGSEDINNIISECFEESIFKILDYDRIRKVKREYFSEYINEYFFELLNEEFIGEFEDWKDKDYPPILIQKFIDIISVIVSLKGIRDFRILITNFAELGNTENEVVNVKYSDLREGLFLMSKYNYSVWIDNIIINIIDGK